MEAIVLGRCCQKQSLRQDLGAASLGADLRKQESGSGGRVMPEGIRGLSSASREVGLGFSPG